MIRGSEPVEQQLATIAAIRAFLNDFLEKNLDKVNELEAT